MISIRLQKRLMFIPLINGLILFFWLYNWFRMNWGNAAAIKAFLILVVSAFLPSIIRDAVASVLPVFNSDIWSFLISYISFLAMSFGLIRLQVNLLKENSEDSKA